MKPRIAGRRLVLIGTLTGAVSAEAVVLSGTERFAGSPREQVIAAEQTVEALRTLQCWENMNCNGDEIRRYLGTVGTKSPLFMLDKALKSLYAEIDDIDSVPDLEELTGAMQQADYLAYSTLFAIASGGMDPKPYMRDCLKQVERLHNDLRALVKVI